MSLRLDGSWWRRSRLISRAASANHWTHWKISTTNLAPKYHNLAKILRKLWRSADSISQWRRQPTEFTVIYNYSTCYVTDIQCDWFGQNKCCQVAGQHWIIRQTGLGLFRLRARLGEGWKNEIQCPVTVTSPEKFLSSYFFEWFRRLKASLRRRM